MAKDYNLEIGAGTETRTIQVGLFNEKVEYRTLKPVVSFRSSMGNMTKEISVGPATWHIHPRNQTLFSNFNTDVKGGDIGWVETYRRPIYLGVINSNSIFVCGLECLSNNYRSREYGTVGRKVQ